MLLERLIQVAPRANLGYSSEQFAAILTIAQDGRHVSFETLPKESPREETVPVFSRSSNVAPGLIIDDFIYAFGCGELSNPKPSHTDDRHNAYKVRLESLNHPAFKAMRAYLDNPDRPLLLPLTQELSSDQLASLEAVDFQNGLLPKEKANMAKLDKNGSGNPETLQSFAWSIHEARRHHPNPSTTNVLTLSLPVKAKVLVLVEGLGKWWLDTEVVTLRAALLREGPGTSKNKGAKTGQCAVTLQTVELARIIPASGKASLVSVNSSAFESFNQEQAYNSPVSLDIAEQIAGGLERLLEHAQLSCSEQYVIWAADGSVLDVASIFSKGRTVAETTAYLESLADDQTFCYLCLGVNMGRWIVRDYQEIQGVELKRNLLEWGTRATFPSSSDPSGEYLRQPWMIAGDIYPPKSRRAANLCQELIRFAVLRIPAQRAPLHDILNHLVDKGTLNNSHTAYVLRWVFYGEICTMKKLDLLDLKTLERVSGMLDKASPSDRLAFGLGYQFLYWERLEQSKSAPSKLLSERFWTQFLNYPRKTYVKIMGRFMQGPRSNRPGTSGMFQKDTQVSQKVMAFLTQFGIGVPGVSEGLGTALLIPVSLNDSQKFFANQGYEWANLVREMYFAELKAQKEQGKAEEGLLPDLAA